MIDASNKNGSLEFTIAGMAGDFFPIKVSFLSTKSYCNIEVGGEGRGWGGGRERVEGGREGEGGKGEGEEGMKGRRIGRRGGRDRKGMGEGREEREGVFQLLYRYVGGSVLAALCVCVCVCGGGGSMYYV